MTDSNGVAGRMDQALALNLRSLLETAEIPLFILNPDGVIPEANGVFRRLASQLRLPMPGGRFAQLLAEESQDKFARFLLQAVEDGEKHPGAVTLHGRTHPLTHLTLRCLGKAPPDGWLILLEIADPVTGQTVLAREFTHLVTDAICQLDEEGVVVFANRAMADLCGCEVDALAGKPLVELLPGVDGRELVESAPTGSAAEQEVVIQAAGGKSRICRLTCRSHREAAGSVPLHVVTLRDVTEYKALEQQLRKDHIHLNEAQKVSQSGSWEWDLVNDEVRWSPGMYRIFEQPVLGYVPTSRSFIELVHENDRDMVLNEITRCRTMGISVDFTCRLASSGNDRILLGRAVPDKNSEGRIVRLLGTAQDISVQRHEEEVRRAREEQLNLIFNTTESGSWEWMVKTGDVLFNDYWFRTLGYDAAQVPSNREFLESIIHPDDKERTGSELTAHLVGNRGVFESELRLHTANRGYRWFLRRGVVVSRDEDGQPQRMVGVDIDVHERHRQMEQLKLAHHSLNYAKESFYWVDRHGTIINANNTACERLGYTRDELLGMTVFDINSEGLREQWEQRWIDTGLQVSRAYETVHRRRDGTLFPVEVRVSRIHFGDLECNFVSATDVTEYKRQQEELRHAQKLEAVGTLAGGIAHDFNNILQIIIGNMQLSLMNLRDTESVELYLNDAQQAGIRARDLVGQLLAFSRQSVQARQALDIYPLVNETTKLLRSTTPANIQISTFLNQGLGLVNTDPIQIQQIVMNLCTNAVQAIGEQSGEVKIHLERVALAEDEAYALGLIPGTYICLSVQDNGPGIPQEIRQHIFEPFFTTKDVGKGSGLGLSVVHGIVRDHKGGIWLDDRITEGTRFCIYLPIAETATPFTTEAPTSDIVRGEGRFLYVEDEQLLCEVGARMLRQIGYEVDAYTDPRNALAAVERGECYDALLTDQAMPGMTGVELARRLRAIGFDRPLFICTGYSDSLTPEAAEELGFVAYLEKPFTVSQLASALSGKTAVRE